MPELVTRDLESRHPFRQVGGLTVERQTGGGRLLDHGGVLLRHLIHLIDGAVDLGQPDRLLLGRAADFPHKHGDLVDTLGNARQGVAGFTHQHHPLFDQGAAGRDQGLDLFGGLGGPLGQGAHLRRHDGKAATGFACSRRLHAGVQGQKVCLEGDLVDHADDLADLLRRAFNLVHGADSTLHNCSPCLGPGSGLVHHRISRLSIFGGLSHRSGNLVEGGGGFFEAGCLTFRPLREVGRRLADLRGARLHRACVTADNADGVVQRRDRAIEVVTQGGVVAGEGLDDAAGQITGRHGRKRVSRGLNDGALHPRRFTVGFGAAFAFFFGGRDVRSELDHLIRPIRRIEDGIVRSLDHHASPALSVSYEFGGDEFAGVQASPELDIGGRLGFAGVHEHPVMTPFDLGKLIAQHRQEIGIGLPHGSVEIEFDHRLRPVHRREHVAKLSDFPLPGRTTT
ncbi:hypothetical protein D3C72_806870 [compost metagenome]